MKKSVTTFTLLLTVFLLPATAFAHQPRIVEENPTVVTLPEVSKAYYGKLEGKPAVYTIASDKAFALYVSLLVPDSVGQKKDISAVILKEGKQIASLDGISFTWKQFFEPFGHDTYWQGPEYRMQVGSGKYEIRVTSQNNDSKYSLAVGEREAFDFKEGMSSLKIIPEIKKDFFNESPISFILSPFGWGLIVIMFILAGLFGLTYRFVLKKFARDTRGSASKNIGKSDRIVRLIIGLALFITAITTSWSPWILFCSGFAFFEFFFSWCGLYAALGKNTCISN